MERKNIIQKLVKEGMSEKTLAGFSDKQISLLANRMLGEAITTTVDAMNKNPQIAALAKKPGVDVQVVKETNKSPRNTKKPLSKNQKNKMDTDKDGDIDGIDLKNLRSKKQDVKEMGDNEDKITFIVPKQYIGYLFNGDASELEDSEMEQAQEFENQISSMYGNSDFQCDDPDGEDRMDNCYRNDVDNSKGADCVRCYIVPTQSDKKMMSEKKAPSAGLTKKKKSEVVKAAKAGKDIGKKGKGFKEIEKKASKSGAKNPKAVAGAAMWKNIKKESVEVKNWLNGLVETEYHPFTSKAEILELIEYKMGPGPGIAEPEIAPMVEPDVEPDIDPGLPSPDDEPFYDPWETPGENPDKKPKFQDDTKMPEFMKFKNLVNAYNQIK